jgi:hypothetical protein
MKGASLASTRQVNGVNLFLATTVAGLAFALFLRQQADRRDNGAEQTAPDANAPAADGAARRVLQHTLPAAYGHDPKPLEDFGGIPAHASCKSAIRLVESADNFLLSLALRNLATNTVELQLQGSLLSILTSHRQRDDSIIRQKNSIMLPAAVVTNPAPTYFLTNDLLQIRVCKRSSMH